MLDQTVRTDDFVIVCDGPLTAELDAVLERHLAQNPAVLHLVRLPQNIGTGAALNIGLTHLYINQIHTIINEHRLRGGMTEGAADFLSHGGEEINGSST